MIQTEQLVLAKGHASGTMVIEAVYVFEMCGREIIFTAAPRWAPNVPDRTLGGMYLLNAIVMQWCDIMTLLSLFLCWDKNKERESK